MIKKILKESFLFEQDLLKIRSLNYYNPNKRLKVELRKIKRKNKRLFISSIKIFMQLGFNFDESIKYSKNRIMAIGK